MDSSNFVAISSLGSPLPPTMQQIGPFTSEELCNKALEIIKADLNAPIHGQRTFRHLLDW